MNKTAEIVVREYKSYYESRNERGVNIEVHGEPDGVRQTVVSLGLSPELIKGTSYEVERVEFVPWLTQLVTLTKNNPLAAIKRLRELTGLDLKSAKDLIDSIGHNGWAV